ncbi:spermatogenesis-associated protein [Trichophyton mentagrophytes]|nr:spermatogenesis-associated protein [Trichophyton mentagrophytes]
MDTASHRKRIDESAGSAASAELVNRLSESRSPYVRGHMNNPVAWQLWDSTAINKAKQLNRLIFLSIGYSACHWCHVMEKESFMSAEVAAILNKSFIPIKLDREERPDIDDVYMNYVQATTGSGGWPLNVFLTPDLEPVFGGTYWPGPNATPLPKLGGEEPVGFIDVLEKLRDVWNTQQLRCRESAKEITRQLREFAEEGIHLSQVNKSEQEEDLEVDLLEEAFTHFAARYDATNGGFSGSPKFPTPVNLSFLLRLSRYPEEVMDIVGREECAKATEMAVNTMIKVARGGIRDQIGYGFSRYSVTPDWSLPHFEKMLYDQAQLLDVFIDGFEASHEPELLGAIYDLVTYITSPPILSPMGCFYSSEDADSQPSPEDTEKREGAYYVWTLKELKQILGQRDADVCARHWGVLPDGNVARVNDPHDEFMNRNVLRIATTPSQVAKEFGLNEEETIRILKTSRVKLREYRETKRVRPELDDKIIVAWNGLVIGALAKCAILLEDIDAEKSKHCRLMAGNAVKFIKENLFDAQSGQLWRIYRADSRGDTPGFADDYAYLISGLLQLYEATFDDAHLQFADKLQQYLNKYFISVSASDSSICTGFYMTPSEAVTDTPSALFRLKTGTDSATPSTNGVIAQNLLRLSSLLEDESYKLKARQTCHAFAVEIMQHPFLFVGMLDVIVGLEIGTKSVTGVLGRAAATGDDSVKAESDLIRKIRAEAGRTASTSAAVLSMVDVRQSRTATSSWLRERNPLFTELSSGKDYMLICEAGSCRTVDVV